MKEYIGKTIEVEIDGEKFEAFYPDEHPSIKAVICKWVDTNAGDDYANLTNYYIWSYVMFKGSDNWEKIYVGYAWMYYTGNRNGLGAKLERDDIQDNDTLLFAFEPIPDQRLFKKKERIAELKEEVEQNTQLLKLMEHELSIGIY